MKRYFSNLFTIVPIENVESINGNTINFMDGYESDLIPTKNDLEFTETQKVSGSNDYYSQSCSPVSHPVDVDSTTRSKYRRNKVIVQLQTTQGDIFTWGTLEIPVRVKINSELNADKWVFTRSSIDPLIN